MADSNSSSGSESSESPVRASTVSGMTSNSRASKYSVKPPPSGRQTMTSTRGSQPAGLSKTKTAKSGDECCYTLRAWVFRPISGLVYLIARIALVVINFVLLSIGITMIALGAVITSRQGFVKNAIASAKEKYEKTIRSLQLQNTAPEASQLVHLLDYVAYIFIGTGIVTGIISFMGCCGGCCRKRKLLVWYTGAVQAICSIELIVIAVIYNQRSIGKAQMLETLKPYGGAESPSAMSQGWNLLMQFGGCCGVDNYKDFQGLKNWPPQKLKGQTLSVKLATPIMCCKGHPTDISCAEENKATPKNNNMEKGCYDMLFDKLFYAQTTIGLIVSMLVFQYGVSFLSIWIFYGIPAD